jgi:hypothetical protein
MDLSPLVRIAARTRLAKLDRQDPARAQARVLLEMVRQARGTRFGIDHDFAGIGSVRDFQDRVPIRQFAEFWSQYWQPAWPRLDNVSWPGRIPFFAMTSGTSTGRTKYIPVTRRIIKDNERVGFDLMAHHLAHRPESRPLAGKSFILGGSTALEEVAPGVFAGDVSGINTMLTPAWVKRNIFPPADQARIANWDEKLDVLSRLVLDERVTMMSGMCNWVLFMLDRVRELRRATGAVSGPTFPDLQLLIHGGVAMDIYRDRLAPHLDGAPVETRELYPASEGFIAYADRGHGEGMRLMCDNRLFFEFVPMSELGSDRPVRHWASNIERDVDYALVLSNCAGLWSYLLGDVVRFVDVRPPRLLILGRITQKLNPFGEHLIAAELEEAVQAAAREIGVVIVEFTVGPVFPQQPGQPGHHVYVVETTAARGTPDPGLTARFVNHLDRVLRESNYDYDGHRQGDSAIGRPRVCWVGPGTFEAWMRSKGKMGRQHKVPHVTPQPDRFAAMCDELGVPGAVQRDRNRIEPEVQHA